MKARIAARVAAVVTLVFSTAAAQAAITRLDIRSSAAYGRFGDTDFVRLEGEAHGELATDEPIPGLERAAANAHGRVEYKAPFVIVAPAGNARGNGTLLIDVPNRGRPIAHFLYNSGRGNFGQLSFDARDGFLQKRGFTVAMIQWELGQGIVLPSFSDAAGTRRFVEGVGLAALRDFAHFLKTAPAPGNPLAGRVDRTLAVGYSQTARLLKTMVVTGFHRAGGVPVFDGLHVHASASGLADVMATGSGPASSTFFTPRFTHPEHRGVTEEPLTYAGIVAAAARGGAVPRMLVTNATTDYWSIRASLSRTGAGGIADLPIPPEVRIYDIAGTSHSRATERRCRFAPGQLDFFPVMRTTLLHLDAWVRGTGKPPPSRLMPLEPLPHEAALLQAPAHLPGAVVQVPKRDADGNALGGVRLPEIAVPLGTHGAQNPPFTERACNLDAAYIPFAATRAARAPDDTRAAVAERYRDVRDYAKRIEAAARALVRERFMLPEDADAVAAAARRAF